MTGRERMAPPRGAEPTQKVTLADVARRAGVSTATASKAINDRAEVSAATRARVLDAAEALAFVPNPFARALNLARTGTIGMLTSDLDNRFVLPILLGAEDAFGAGSLSVILADARDDVEREGVHIRGLLSRRVDGLLVVGRTTNPRPPVVLPSPVPVVYVYAPSTDDEDVSFTPDNALAGRLAARHLLDRGRTRIAVVNGDPTYVAATDRAEGVRAELAERGLAPVGGSDRFGTWSEVWGREAARALLDGPERPDGIVCASDQIARGVADALRDAGLRIPADVAVMGFDNWNVFTEGARPPLTSVDMELEQLGRSAAQALVRAIAGEASAGRSSERVHVVGRESTGLTDHP